MRHLTAETLRFLSEEKKMVLVAGPRQAGKTTLPKHLPAPAGERAAYFNWDIESHRKAILRSPACSRARSSTSIILPLDYP
jgi:predicted AAA+ superfamily ATPase